MRAGFSVFCSRESVDKLLSAPRPASTLKCRIGSLRRLAQDCERFYPMPTLIASLEEDIARIARVLHAADPAAQAGR